MPLDGTAPPEGSAWAERLARLKIIRRKARAEQRKLRRFSKERLRVAEHLLAEIIDGADLIGEAILETRSWCTSQGVFLLVALPSQTFQQLCELGAEMEDLEDSHDAEETEADHGEVDEYPAPSLTNPTGDDLDFECGRMALVDREQDVPLPPEKVAAARERYRAKGEINPPLSSNLVRYVTLDPESQRVASWLQERRASR